MQTIRLVGARRKHAELWWRIRQQEGTRRFCPILPLSIDDLAQRIRLGASDLSRRDVLEYRWIAVWDRQEIGTVALYDPNWSMQTVFISYMILEAFHGKGLGKLAVRALVDKVFEETPFVRLTAEVAEDNVASWALLERLGFTREGLLREHLVIGGRRVNHYLYGLLRREWKKR